MLKHDGSMWLTLSIVDNVSTMSGEEENSALSVVATAQPQTSHSTMFHQILPPQYLDLRTTGEIAENWKLWKEKYNY